MVHKKYILAISTLISLFSAASVHAADVDFSVVVSEVPVLEITLSDSTETTPTTISQNIKPNPDGTPTFTTSNVYVTVATSNSTGHYLNMHTSSTSLTSGSNKIPSLTADQTCTVATASSCTFTANSWGYRLSTDAVNTYKPIPDDIGEDIDHYDTVTNGKSVNVVLGTKIDASLPAGSYATTISFVATANPIPYSFAKAYAMAGKTQTNGYYSMQDMTADICAMIDDLEAATLMDARDKKTYTVAKILGKCWMTQNLDLAGGTVLTSTLSNVTSNYTLPNSSTGGFYSESAANVYNTGNTNCSASRACYSYYTFVAANAGNNPSGGSTSSDICPRNWRLPTYAEYRTYLTNTYNTGARLNASPWHGVYNGYYVQGSFHNTNGTEATYWTASAYESTNAWILYYADATSTVPYSGPRKYMGSAVRCFAK